MKAHFSKSIATFSMLLYLVLTLQGQSSSYNFHKLGLEQGLNDGIVRDIGQDKFGYIWVATIGGLNRYNGKTFTKYLHTTGDTLSPYRSQPRSIHSDLSGRLWIGFETGLMQYNFANKNFIRNKHFNNLFIHKIVSISENILFIGTNKGLFKYDVLNDTAINYATSPLKKHLPLKDNKVFDIKYKQGILYLGTQNGLVYFNEETDAATYENNTQLLNLPIPSLDIDASGNVWICSYGAIKLARLNVKDHNFENYNHILEIGNDSQPFHVPACHIDQKNRLWVITVQVGLMLYDSISNSFIKIKHQENIPSSPIGDSYRCIFEDNSGLIWLGFDVEGVNYFNPDKNQFYTLLPFPEQSGKKLNRVGRAVTVDKNGNLWLGNHDGLSRLNLASKKYEIFRNEPGQKEVLVSNHIRSLLSDDENNIWIGTNNGVNRYNSTTKKIEFIHQLPTSFYNSINMDRSGNVWFCTNDSAALYSYSKQTKSFNAITENSAFKPLNRYAPASYFLEDKKARWWISYGRKGVVMYDPEKKALKHYSASDSTTNGIIGNQVIDIKEDKNGVIWLATLNGLSSINVDQNIVTSYSIKNGLVSNMAGPLVIDNANKLWVGINGGLTLIEENRKSITTYTEADGISSTGFPEHAGIKTADGHIIFPSNIGYLLFDPGNFKDDTNFYPFYISQCRVLDNEIVSFNEEGQTPQLMLSHEKSSFTFDFVALNFKKPDKTYFAYKLEGFEKNWHYTTEPHATYTNVPGGNYRFLMKSSDTNANWDNIKPRQVSITLATVFYKTTWFVLLTLLIISAIIYYIYTNRSRQHKQLYDLKNKAQLLEKEKATAMFENLKQQLNPHFLFNSLTSLSGLIEMDKQLASGFLNQLSVIYRYILKNAENETVSLRDEIAFVTMYINLQKTRFSEGFNVNITVPDHLMDRKIAPVTLQNMIENAIKHNIIDKRKPLTIDIYTEGETYIIIKNNLQKKSVVESSNQKGLKQFISLYHYLTDLPVIIDDQDTAYFTIKIPLL